jgi:crossover junction endonuclease EME1
LPLKHHFIFLFDLLPNPLKMPTEIIDLVSSPDLPRPARSKVNKSVPPSKALTYEPPKPLKDDWFDLSSDGVSLPPSRPLAANSSLSTESIPAPCDSSKPIQAGSSAGGIEFFFLSDELDTTLSPLNAPAFKPAGISTLSKTSSAGALKQDKLANPTRLTNEFDCLSDDFDDPFASDEPLPKKRRLTPSPIAVAPKKTEFKRSTSNIESSSKIYTSRTTYAPILRQSKTMSTVLESDPIMFTSSPDPFAEAARRSKEPEKRTLHGDEEDDPSDVEAPRGEIMQNNIATGNGILESSYGNKGKGYTSDYSSDLDIPDIGSLVSKPTLKPAKISQDALAKYNSEKAKERAAREKAEKQKEKRALKEAEKERKKFAREQKVRDKEKAAEVARVNILRTDKKVSAPEMIVDISSSLNEKLAEQARNFLIPMHIEHSDWQSSLPVIRWRRKVIAQWNDDMGHWEPVPLRIKTEKHIMCILSAKEFVDLAMADEGQDLDAHVLRLKAKFESSEIIYMIEGLTAWMRKNRNVKNRQFTAAVRSHLDLEEQAPTASQKTKKKKVQEYVDEDMIGDALLRLQVIHGTLIHHTAVMIETAEWIVAFTQQISTIPYKYGFPFSYQANF